MPGLFHPPSPLLFRNSAYSRSVYRKELDAVDPDKLKIELEMFIYIQGVSRTLSISRINLAFHIRLIEGIRDTPCIFLK